jgi:hypothetical protein
MINHVRTLLLNADGSKAFPPDYPGEEFVDPDFRVLALPGPLKLVRSCLFSPTPDRAMINYRLRQLLSLVHSCELEEFVTAPDPRVTYWPTHNTDVFDRAAFGTTIKRVVGDGDLYVQGSADLVAVSQLLHRWQVSVRYDGTVSVDRQTEPLGQDVYEYTLTGGLSQALPLAGTPQTFYFRETPVRPAGRGGGGRTGHDGRRKGGAVRRLGCRRAVQDFQQPVDIPPRPTLQAWRPRAGAGVPQ